MTKFKHPYIYGPDFLHWKTTAKMPGGAKGGCVSAIFIGKSRSCINTKHKIANREEPRSRRQQMEICSPESGSECVFASQQRKKIYTHILYISSNATKYLQLKTKSTKKQKRRREKRTAAEKKLTRTPIKKPNKLSEALSSPFQLFPRHSRHFPISQDTNMPEEAQKYVKSLVKEESLTHLEAQ